MMFAFTKYSFASDDARACLYDGEHLKQRVELQTQSRHTLER